MSRFETKADLRRELERRLGPLSDEDWGSLDPSWSGAYGDGDVEELLRSAESLPSLAIRRLEDFTRDVERLRRQVFGDSPYEDRMCSGFVGALAAEILYRWVAEDAPLASGEQPAPHPYTLLGREVHASMAADWLARQHGVDCFSALEALIGYVKPEEALAGHHYEGQDLPRVKGRLLPKVSRSWDKVVRGYQRGRGYWHQFRARDRSLRSRVSATDSAPLYLLEIRHAVLGKRHRLSIGQRRLACELTGGHRTVAWEELRRVYEVGRRKRISRGDLSADELRRFTHWRAFRMAALRAQRKKGS